jgi:hypothetical protein
LAPFSVWIKKRIPPRGHKHVSPERLSVRKSLEIF